MPRGTIELRRGDCIAFASDSNGAHRISNDGASECTILMIGTTDRGDVCFYPDSRKLLVEAADDLIVRSEPVLAYLDGE